MKLHAFQAQAEAAQAAQAVQAVHDTSQLSHSAALAYFQGRTGEPSGSRWLTGNETKQRLLSKKAYTSDSDNVENESKKPRASLPACALLPQGHGLTGETLNDPSAICNDNRVSVVVLELLVTESFPYC